jgi:TatA/E family protein of Tat protein translocase
MPFKLGWIEILLILVIVFIIFGAGKLPQLFEMFGKKKKVADPDEEEEVKPKKKRARA